MPIGGAIDAREYRNAFSFELVRQINRLYYPLQLLYICASVLRNTSIKLMEDDVILYFSIGDLKHLTSYKKIVRSFARKLQQRQLEQVVDLFWVWSDEKNGSRNGEQLRVHPRAISTSTELSRLL